MPVPNPMAAPEARPFRRWRGPAMLMVLAVLFMALAAAVARGWTGAIDTGVLLALRVPGHPAVPRGPGWLAGTVIALTSLGSPPVLWAIVGMAAGGLAGLRRLRAAAWLLATVASGLGLVSVHKLWFDRPRPMIVPHLVAVQTRSFPSGHAADSAIVYLALAVLALQLPLWRSARPCLAAAAVALIVTIGLTRLYLGVHWPSDVAAGWLFGAFWALLADQVRVFRTEWNTK